MTDFEQPQAVKYNPAFLSEDDLVRGFVVRELDLELLVDTVRDNDALPNHHVIVVGPRGSGKTTLLRRATITVKRDSTLGRCWYPLVFAEESYQVTSAGEFWLEAVFQLAEQTGDPALSRTHQQLNRDSDDDRLRERALGLLLDFADAVGKRLLMVVENFHMLTEQMSDDDAWKIRHTLQNEHRIMFMASATTRFDAIDRADRAFYELFKIHELRPLNPDECHAVWVSASGKQPPTGSIRPIQILTGGNLRLMTIIARFGAGRSFRALLTDLMVLVDEHTEYFKSHLDGLPTTERKVYLALAEHWAPATARETSQIARLDVHRTSALLGRLVRRGAACTVELDGSQKRYQLAERLYNVYYLMRRRGSPSHRVKAAVSFMVGYYGPAQLVDIAIGVARDACEPDSSFRMEHILAYEQILEHPDVAPFRARILRSTPRAFFRSSDIPTTIRERLASVLHGHFPVSDRHDTSTLLSEIDDLDKDAAEARCRAMIAREPESAGGWARMGYFMAQQLEDLAEAEAALHEAVRLDPEYAWAWAHLGRLLGGQEGRARAAEQALRRAIEILARDGALSFDEVLQSFAERFEEAPPDHDLLNAIAWDLFRLAPSSYFERAATWARRAFEAAPEKSQARSYSAHTLASLTAALGQFDEAGNAARIYLTDADVVGRTTKDAIELLVDFAARGEGSRALQLLRDSPSAEQLETLLVALELDAGIRRPAPHEILEVAKDIQRDIEARRVQLQRRARPL